VAFIKITKYAPSRLALSRRPTAGTIFLIGRTSQFVTAKTKGPREFPDAGLREIF